MCCMSETRLGQFTYEMGRFNTAAPLRTDCYQTPTIKFIVPCYQTPTIKFIVPCLQKQGHLIFKGLHQVAQYHAAQPRAAGFQLEGFAWREAVITRALPEVSLLVLPSDGWRVLPADLQVYPPIWRAGGRLANTLLAMELCLSCTNPSRYWLPACSGPNQFNKCWLSVNWSLKNKPQWTFHPNTFAETFAQENVFQNVCKQSAITEASACYSADKRATNLACQWYWRCIRPILCTWQQTEWWCHVDVPVPWNPSLLQRHLCL